MGNDPSSSQQKTSTDTGARSMMRMCDEDVMRMKSGDEYHELRRMWNWPSGSSSSPRKSSFWGVDKRGNDVRVELVVADMDTRFLGCVNKMMGDDVTIRHEPLQKIISESLRDRCKTYVVFGSYGIFPNESDEHAGLRSGVSKAISRIFPRSWKSFREQSRRCLSKGSSSDDMPWMELMGRVFMAEPEIEGLMSLVACAAYPRDQRPTEEDAAARRYLSAFKMIMRCENIQSLYRSPQCSNEKPSKCIRIVTHAVGSFVGHDTVDVFAIGIKKALTDLLS